MFSKNLRLPLFGLLVLAALTLLALAIFSSDEEESNTTLSQVETTTSNDSQEDDDAPAFYRNLGGKIVETSPEGNEIGEGESLIDVLPQEETIEKEAPVEKPATVKVEEPKATPSTKGQVVEYKIKSGDAISKIAQRFGCKSTDIYRLNKRINKSNANKIQVGWTIQVLDNKGIGGKVVSKAVPIKTDTEAPVKVEEKSDAPKVVIKRDPPVVPVAPKLEEAQTHILRSGDTYFTLAIRYYGSINNWQLIRNANPHWDIVRSQPGIELKIPALNTGKEDLVSNKGKKGLVPSGR